MNQAFDFGYPVRISPRRAMMRKVAKLAFVIFVGYQLIFSIIAFSKIYQDIPACPQFPSLSGNFSALIDQILSLQQQSVDIDSTVTELQYNFEDSSSDTAQHLELVDDDLSILKTQIQSIGSILSYYYPLQDNATDALNQTLLRQSMELGRLNSSLTNLSLANSQDHARYDHWHSLDVATMITLADDTFNVSTRVSALNATVATNKGVVDDIITVKRFSTIGGILYGNHHYVGTRAIAPNNTDLTQSILHGGLAIITPNDCPANGFYQMNGPQAVVLNNAFGSVFPILGTPATTVNLMRVRILNLADCSFTFGARPAVFAVSGYSTFSLSAFKQAELIFGRYFPTGEMNAPSFFTFRES